jgi:O-antigen ligase
VGLDAVFLAACLRLQIAAVLSSGPGFLPTAVMVAGSLGLGAWNPGAALLAFALAAPVLSGLSQSALLGCTFSASLVFSGIWTGTLAGRLLRGGPTAGGLRSGSSEANGKPDGTGATGSTRSDGRSGALLTADILIAVASLSLAWQLWRHRGDAGAWSSLLRQPVFGYGDPRYYVTSAFLWLEGLFFFKGLIGLWEGRSAAPAAGAGNGPRIAGCVREVFLVYGLTMAVFVVIQLVFHIPEGWTSSGVQSPFEDISSFGSLAAAVLIYMMATWRKANAGALALRLAAGSVLVAMLVASWSRASWLAGVVFLLLLAVLRLPRLLSAGLVALALGVAVLVNLTSRAGFWSEQPYLARFAALVRLESPASKDPVRLNLYRKAAAMIRSRPLAGHGIGSFYLTSVGFARPGDPYGSQPDFAHNVFLQVAAEEGLPTATLLAGLVAWTLWGGMRSWRRLGRDGPAAAATSLAMLGATLALGGYLQTQMTANSLNVYASNQFFFWLLLAAVLAMSPFPEKRGS